MCACMYECMYECSNVCMNVCKSHKERVRWCRCPAACHCLVRVALCGGGDSDCFLAAGDAARCTMDAVSATQRTPSPGDCTRRCLPSRLCSSCRLPVLRSTAAAAATEHGTELSKAEVTLVFEQYMEDLKTELRPDQLGKKWTCYKSCTEAKNETHGWTHLQCPRLLQSSEVSGYPHKTWKPSQTPFTVLNWLDRLARAVQRGHERVSRRSAQGRRGTRRVGSLCYRARGTHSHPHSEVQHLAGEMSGERIHGRQKELIRALGTEAPRRLQAESLQERLVEVKSQYQGDPMHRSPCPSLSNATEHAAERPATEPTHVALECSRSQITIEQATATARATT